MLGLLLSGTAIAQQPILLPPEQQPSAELWQRLQVYDALQLRYLLTQVANLQRQVRLLEEKTSPFQTPIPPIPAGWYRLLAEQEAASAAFWRESHARKQR